MPERTPRRSPFGASPPGRMLRDFLRVPIGRDHSDAQHGDRGVVASAEHLEAGRGAHDLPVSAARKDGRSAQSGVGHGHLERTGLRHQFPEMLGNTGKFALRAVPGDSCQPGQRLRPRDTHQIPWRSEQGIAPLRSGKQKARSRAPWRAVAMTTRCINRRYSACRSPRTSRIFAFAII